MLATSQTTFALRKTWPATDGIEARASLANCVGARNLSGVLDHHRILLIDDTVAIHGDFRKILADECSFV